MSYGNQIRRVLEQALNAAPEYANQVQLAQIEDAARNALTTVTVVEGLSASLPVDCLDLYRDIPDWEPAIVTGLLTAARATVCNVPLTRLRGQLITLSNELYAVSGLQRWANTVGDLAGMSERPIIERDKMFEDLPGLPKTPNWVWLLVGLFVLDRVSRFGR